MSEQSERDLMEGAAVDGGAGTARRAEAGCSTRGREAEAPEAGVGVAGQRLTRLCAVAFAAWRALDPVNGTAGAPVACSLWRTPSPRGVERECWKPVAGVLEGRGEGLQVWTNSGNLQEMLEPPQLRHS